MYRRTQLTHCCLLPHRGRHRERTRLLRRVLSCTGVLMVTSLRSCGTVWRSSQGLINGCVLQSKSIVYPPTFYSPCFKFEVFFQIIHVFFFQIIHGFEGRPMCLRFFMWVGPFFYEGKSGLIKLECSHMSATL